MPITSGRVTKTARKMVMEWGMSEKLGPLPLGNLAGKTWSSSAVSGINYSEGGSCH